MLTETSQDERYALLERLGAGGMGVVWRARDTVLERDVAVKDIPLPAPVDDGDAGEVRARALREARAAARPTHPRVTQVFDVETNPDRVRIVMELLEADSLVQRVTRAGVVDPREAARIGLDVLDGLAAAHRVGVVHRDVKAANVLVDADGRAKLTDFGVASLRDQPRLTAAGQVMGSPAYMAPERARDGTATPASDLWSLGATLYFAVEGRPPFDRGQPMATVAAVLEEAPARPRNAGPLEPALTALLTKEPDARPDVDTARALLERALDAPAGGVSTDAADSPPRGWRHTAVAGALLAILGFAGASLASTSTPGDRLFTGFGTRGDAASDAGPPGDDTDSTAPRNDTGAQSGHGSSGQATGPQAHADGEQASQGQVDATAESPPDGWTTYTDEDLGYSLQVPSHWKVVPLSGNRTDFRDPSSPTYLRVDYTADPPTSAVGAWQDLSTSFAARHAGYEELRIEPTTYQGLRAAVWEYRYAADGVTLHAANLGFGTDEFGHALNFVTAEEDWRDSQEVFGAIQATFRPAGPPG